MRDEDAHEDARQMTASTTFGLGAMGREGRPAVARASRAEEDGDYDEEDYGEEGEEGDEADHERPREHDLPPPAEGESAHEDALQFGGSTLRAPSDDDDPELQLALALSLSMQ